MKTIMYLVEVSGCLTIFYGMYLTLFRNTTFFLANRVYLVSGIVLSFIIPCLENPFVTPEYPVLPGSFSGGSSLFSGHLNSTTISVAPRPVDFQWLPFLYWSGVAVMTLRFLNAIKWVIQVKRRSRVHFHQCRKVFVLESQQPFSFFNMIFLPEGEINPIIFEHEKAHIRRHHWLDLLIIEVACSLLWFNPVMIFYRRSLKTQHEYEADAGAIKACDSLEEYLNSILYHLKSELKKSAIISQFFNLNIKQRIIMMTKSKTPKKFSLLYILLVPLVCLLLFAFTNQSMKTSSLDLSDQSSMVIIVDAGHGGVDQGAQSPDGIMEKELTLALARRIQKEGELKNVKVILTRMDDQALSLEDRVSATRRSKADIFLSLHVNSKDQDPSASGIETIVSEKNVRFAESRAWSDKLLRELTGLTGMNINGVKKSDFYLLTNNSVPAVLLEVGYLSNKADNAYLVDPKNQQLISEKIIAAFSTRGTGK